MKLQSASRKEISRMAVGVLVCDILLAAALFLLSLVGVGAFSLPRVLLGALCGSLVAIGNFTVLCLTVQSAVEMDNKHRQKQRFQLSYNLRLLIQAAWVVICFLVPQIHFVAGAAPILFPNVVIFFLQSRGKLVEPSEKATPSLPDDDEDGEDHLESFEI